MAIFTRLLLLMPSFLLLAPFLVTAAAFGSAHAVEPIKIAAIFSQTGIAASHNAPLLPMVELAVEELNRNGGLLGRPVALTLIDNQSTAIGSSLAAEEAVRLGVAGVIGAHWSSHSLAMAPVLQRAGIPMISPGSTNPEVTRVGDYIFRACFIDSFQGEVMAWFASSELGAKTAAVLSNMDEAYSVTLAEYFTRSFTEGQGRIVLEEGYRGKAVNFADLLQRVKELKPDVVYVPGYTRDSALIILQAASMGIKTTFLGGDAWDEIYEFAGSAVEGSYQTTPWHPEVPFPASIHLQKLYEERSGKQITNMSAPLAYDAVMLLADAIKRAGTSEHAAVRDKLAETRGFQGATGPITFGESRDPREKEAIILKYEKTGPKFFKVIGKKEDRGQRPEIGDQKREIETIDIAAIYALTGASADSNANSLQGVRAGVDELNARGGILGKRLNLLVFDNQSSPIGSSVAAEKAAAANVVAILGSVWSSHSIPIARVAQEKAIPMISNFSTHLALTEIGDYIFRVCFTDDFQGEIMARFARQELKAKTAVVFINLTSDYSLGLSRLFRQAFEKQGGRILGEMEYKPKSENLEPLVRGTKEMNADVVFVAGQDESGLIVKLLQDAGVRSIALGGDGWSEDSFLNHGGKDLELGYYCSHWSESSESHKSREFVRKFQNAGQFGVGTALAYDALMLLADAIERAGSVEKEKVRDALAKTTAFEGVTGTIGFNAQRNPLKSAVIMKVRKGERSYFKTLGP